MNRVVPREELMSAALATAATLASYGPPPCSPLLWLKLHVDLGFVVITIYLLRPPCPRPAAPCSVLLPMTRLGSLTDGA